MNTINCKSNIKRKKKLRLKKKIKIIINFLILIIILFIIIFSIKLISFNITSVNLNNDTLTIKYISYYKNIYYYLSEKSDTPTLDSKNWIKCENDSCNISFIKDSYNLWIKNDSKLLYKYDSENIKILEFNFNNNDNIYVALDGTYNVNYTYKSLGIKKNAVSFKIEDESIATINNYVIKGIKNGDTKMDISDGEKSYSVSITVTDLITPIPNKFNSKKAELTCGKYTSEHNKVLDAILKDRIDESGYQTRAGAVEAARFLTLEFPYKISYFYENGRMPEYRNNKVDGEGRYYHIGLYLSESKFTDIKYPSYGPKTWGCSLYSDPIGTKDANGLDCSGFVSWALLNAGFDVDDLGAGIADDHADLTDTGKRTTLTTSILTSDEIKVGDLLFSYRAGGHIAMIVGSDDKNFYVAQAIWYDEYGVVITTYKKEAVLDDFSYVVLMDSYYKKDGNYTELWY